MDPHAASNYTFTQCHKYESLEGRSWDPDTPRIFAHTDESIITLLHTGPGELVALGLNIE